MPACNRNHAQGFDSYRCVALSTSGLSYSWGGGHRCFLGTTKPVSFAEQDRQVKLQALKEGVEEESFSDVDVDLGYVVSWCSFRRKLN